jgi:hypothetical protein
MFGLCSRQKKELTVNFEQGRLAFSKTNPKYRFIGIPDRCFVRFFKFSGQQYFYNNCSRFCLGRPCFRWGHPLHQTSLPYRAKYKFLNL